MEEDAKNKRSSRFRTKLKAKERKSKVKHMTSLERYSINTTGKPIDKEFGATQREYFDSKVPFWREFDTGPWTKGK